MKLRKTGIEEKTETNKEKQMNWIAKKIEGKKLVSRISLAIWYFSVLVSL